VIVCAIQVRMGSTRLPGKALAEVEGKPMLQRLIERVQAARTLDGVVVATTNVPGDEPIRALAAELGVQCFAGSEHDVVDRLHGAARATNASALVRVTGDCPLMDPSVIDQVVEAYRGVQGAADYVSNIDPPTFPDGLDIEVYPLATLEGLDAMEDAFWREWFAVYVAEHPEEFRAVNVQHSPDLSSLRWTVDYDDDLAFVRAVYARLAPADVFGMEDVLELLRGEPELARINEGRLRNSAYADAAAERAR
jgi:spore coat polysaccharide biosynthesis protein SpsF